MRLTPLRLALLFGAALLVLGPTTGLTQPGGFGGKSFKRGGPDGGGAPPSRDGGGPPGGGMPFGGPGGGFDSAAFANMIFDRMANGKDTINISEISSRRDPDVQQKAAAWAQSKGITNGQLTRQQYADFFTEQRGGGAPGGTPPGTSTTPSPADAEKLEKDAENSFRSHDKTNLGYLTKETASRTLQGEFDKWDKNKDGKIDLAEYKEYYKSRRTQTDGRGGPGGDSRIDIANGPDQIPEEDKRQTVYHAGNLPKELPPWFAQLDSDKDGQVGLYEWKRGGGDVYLFMEIDKNGDGFLTVEEVLRYQKVTAKAKTDPNGGTLLAFDEFGEPIEQAGMQPLIPQVAPTGFPGSRGGRGGPPGGAGGTRGPGGSGGWGNPPGGAGSGGNPWGQPGGSDNSGGGTRGPGGFGKGSRGGKSK